MARSVWHFFLAAALIATTAIPSFAENDGAAAARVVALSSRETKRLEDAEMPPSLLLREVMRQAFLIAARDECGLATRDTTLRETVPRTDSPETLSFELYSAYVKSAKNHDVQYVLSRRKNGGLEEVWRQRLPADINNPERTLKLTTAAEELSRTAFKDLLKQSGASKVPPAARTTAAVPSEANRQLWEWNELAVFGAVRRLHTEIRTKGESPELLGALAIGYANLGSLTEYYYSPARKAHFARALLYAERLVHETKGAPFALWHRAYVLTMVGLYDQAFRDVAEAKKSPAVDKAHPLPFWTNVIDAFTSGRLKRMVADAKDTDAKRLALYLNLEAVRYAYMKDITIKAARAVVTECPDCFRAIDSVCDSSEVGLLRMVTSQFFPLLSKSLRERLASIEGLPASVKQFADPKRAGQGGDEGEKGFEDEIERRVQLVTDLKAETTSGRDVLEPSLEVLGQMIEEIEFKHLIRRLETEKNVWGVPTEQTIATFRPLCEHHPYGAYLDAFSSAKSDWVKASESLLRSIDPNELSWTETNMVAWLFGADRKRAMELRTCSAWHLDPVFADEMNGIELGMAGAPDDRGRDGAEVKGRFNHNYMKMLWRTSSKLPISYAIQIQRHWSQAEEFAKSAEQEFADDPIVMTSLVVRYWGLKRMDDAERCAKQRIKAAPDYPAYRELAAIYKEKGDMARWKETLEQSLELPTMGLEHAQVKDTIAHYHMDRKEWKEAVVYADEAAQSYSAWSMLTAALCHEKLGEWKKAEAYLQAVSERYADSSMEWMLWCHRTGRGDVHAADACARNHFESLGTSMFWQTRRQIGAFYLLENEPEKALVVFEKTFDETHGVYDEMHVALAADTLGKTEERDRWLAKIASIDTKNLPNVLPGIYKQVVILLQKGLPPGSAKDLDFKKLDGLIADSSKVDVSATLEYFVGVFLKNRGDREKAKEYLIRAAQHPHHNHHNHVLACQVLREMKVEVPPDASESSPTKK
jgi:tetratricopeptide (TPR) repeat protein